MHAISSSPTRLSASLSEDARLEVVDKGGHFAAWEQPELFSAEMRAAFKSLC
jgi:pimeloyl-ACP methyl ester carboxylesterase